VMQGLGKEMEASNRLSGESFGKRV
jgi:hypothetical protein